jgi:hypothetical protein
VFNRARQDAGHENLCIHQLRIRATTDAFRAGVNPATVKDMGGWKCDQTVYRYFKRSDVDMIDAADKIEAYKNRQ